jgi:hypothetical protein
MTMTRLTSSLSPVSRRRPVVRFAMIVVLIAGALWLMLGFLSAVDRRPARDDDRGARPAVSSQQDRQVLEAETRDRIAALARGAETALRAETVDAAWAGEARQLILEAAAALGATVEDLECRATLCRVRVSHREPAARASFESDFPIAVAQRFSQMLVQPADGDSASAGATLYLARDGRALPDPGAPRGR